jgi:hypothetical protein
MVMGDFDGSTYDPKIDGARLSTQLHAVKMLMSDGQWRTLEDIGRGVEGTNAAISARLRDLRKPKFGGYLVERQRIEGGLYRYRLVLGAKSPDGIVKARRLGPNTMKQCLEILGRTFFKAEDQGPIRELKRWLRVNAGQESHE